MAYSSSSLFSFDSHKESLQQQLAVTLDESYSPLFNREVMERALNTDDYYGENTLAVDVLHSKYLAPNERGPMQMWERIARAIASVEKESEY